MEAHSWRRSSQCPRVTQSLHSKWKHFTCLNSYSCFFLMEVNIKTRFIQVSNQVFNPHFKNMLIVNCNPIKKCNSWEFPLSTQILSFKSHFWVSQFSSSLQLIFCDLKTLSSPHQDCWISLAGWCSAQALPKYSPGGAEESPVCDWITLHWTPRQIINEWGDAKPGRGTSCYQNPGDYNEIHQVDQLPCQGLKCKRTSGFQKPGWDFSQLCLPTHLSWNGLHLVRNHVLVQIWPPQWHQQVH